jgi:preprotein translocase subunit SecD
VTDEGQDYFGVTIELLPSGSVKMHDATASHTGRPIAILLTGDVAVTPTVRSAVGDTAWLTGDYTKAEAESIVAGVMPQ